MDGWWWWWWGGCSPDGGCHGFLSKAFGITAHPLLMSALEERRGGEKGVERDKGRDEGKKGRRGIRDGGGREGREEKGRGEGKGSEAACCS